MTTNNLPRVVLDTNIFVGLTKENSAAGIILDAWRAGALEVCISDSLWYEYEDVFTRLLSPIRWERIEPVLNALVKQAIFTTIYYSWRPSSPDPGDEHVIDCAMNAKAWVVTENLRDFRQAQQELGLKAMRAVDFVLHLAV